MKPHVLLSSHFQPVVAIIIMLATCFQNTSAYIVESDYLGEYLNVSVNDLEVNNHPSKMNLPPIGYLESITADGTISGWACDPDDPNASIRVDFYANAPWDQGIPFASTYTTQASDQSIADLCGGGYNHRFSFTLNASQRNTLGFGTYQVYAHGIDILGGPNPEIGGNPVTLTIENWAPIGNLESITADGTISGWACDPDDPNASIRVDFYANAPWDQGIPFASTYTTQASDQSIADLCGGGYNHRFSFTLNASQRNTLGFGTYQVYAHGIDILGGPNPEIGGNPKTLILLNSLPVGQVEFDENTNTFTGFVCDPDHPGETTWAHIYAYYRAGQDGLFIASTKADLPGDQSVANACNGYSNHRFSYTLNASDLSKLETDIVIPLYVQGKDPIIGPHPVLQNSPFDFELSNAPPIGHVDFDPESNTFTGFVCDPDHPGEPTWAQIYANNRAGQGGKFIASAIANEPGDQSIANECGGYSNHRFTYTLTPQNIDSIGIGDVPLYVQGKDLVTSPHPVLANSPFTFNSGGTSSNIVPLTWAAGISSDCRSMAAPAPVWYEPPFGSECDDSGMWLISATIEDENFTGGSLSDIHHTDSVWDHSFHPKEDGTYQIGWVLDKVNFDCEDRTCRDRYTGVFVNDSWDINTHLDRPNLGDQLFAEFDLGLFASEELHDPDPAVGDAKNRVTIGIVARWNNAVYFLEVNLYRTSNFDLYPADPENLKDRFLQYSTNTGSETIETEIIYFNGNNLSLLPGIDENLPVVTPDSVMRHFKIPVTDLFLSHNWANTPTDWSEAELAGVYLGTEIWGKGRVWYEYDDYQLYRLLSDNQTMAINDISDHQGELKQEGQILNLGSQSNEELELYQNYPNPFNPSTEIRFTLPKASNVKLIVYNMLGQEVATLVDARLTSGRHSYSFNGSDLPSGLYLYQLIAMDEIRSGKMLFLK